MESSGLMTQDFSKEPIANLMAQGRNIGERFIIDKLRQHNVNIVPTNSLHDDRTLKIDGYLDGKSTEPVQIKLRRSATNNRNDVAYEVCRNFNTQDTLTNQLKNVHQQGRDFRGNFVKHYFIMNREETEVYYTTGPILKALVLQSINQMNSSKMGGFLTQSFAASNGVDLRPTRDPDPTSFTPSKVMAFIPVQNAVQQTYPIR